MCGRFTMATNAEALEERFRAHVSTEVAAPTYNAAPSQAQLTILNDRPDAIVHAAWGFVPEWADGRPDVKPLINARAETVATKPYFRDAFKKKRCLILADGFYEWKRTGKSKIPYRIVLKTEEPFAFAGIWSAVHDAHGVVQPTFAILTTEANTLVHIPPNLVVGRCRRTLIASRREDLQVEHPVRCRDATALHFHPTLARVQGPALIRD